MKTILDAIGNTPLINIEGIWVKMEYLNPSGSIKARIAKYIIEKAEQDGLLKPGDTIVEASSGNTGNAMSMVAAVKGYKMLVIMPDGMSLERTAISEAFGAEVHKMGDFHVNDALAEAKRLGIQTFGMVDTNCDPNKVDFSIPANDDATKSIAIITNYITAAIAEGLAERQASKDDEGETEEGNNENEAKAKRMEAEANAEGGRGKRGAGAAPTAPGAPKRRIQSTRRPAGK